MYSSIILFSSRYEISVYPAWNFIRLVVSTSFLHAVEIKKDGNNKNRLN